MSYSLVTDSIIADFFSFRAAQLHQTSNNDKGNANVAVSNLRMRHP
jgi:hypothetical protein